MATTIVTKYGSDAPATTDIVRGELAVDTENGRLYTENAAGAVVEIGLKPEANVDVTGTVTADGLTVAGATALSHSGTTLSIDRTGGATALIELQQASTIRGYLGADSTKSLIVFNGSAAEKFSVSNAGIDITGTATAASFETDAGGTFTTATGNDLNIVYPAGRSLFIKEGSETHVTVDNVGNVGIGTSPSTKLHVADGSDSNAQIRINGSTSTVYSRLYSDNNGVLAIGTDGGNQAANSYMMFEVKGSERMRIDASGNVGIGTSSPDSPLEIQAATNSSSDTTYLKLYNAGENVGNIDFENGNGSLARITGTKAGAGASANDGILTFSTAFDSSLAERMRIDSSGNVGIGTSSPQTSLAIETSGTQDVISPVVTGQTSGVTYGGLYTVRDGAGDQRGLALKVFTANVGLNEVVRISSAGNVKIGDASTDITSKLVVSGNASADVATFMYDNSAGTYFDIDCGAAGGAVKLRADARSGAYPSMLFQTGGAERMRIDASGNVGIGAVPEAWASGVIGVDFGTYGSLVDGTNVIVSRNAYYDGAWKYKTTDHASSYWQGSTGEHIWQTAASGTADAALTWSESMRIDASGNVGIGLTPFGWSSYKNVGVSGSGSLYGTGAGNTLSGHSHGCYYDGANWKYSYTGAGATRYEAVGATSPYQAWYTANSGTADANITFSEAMRIDSSGNLLVGTTDDAPGAGDTNTGVSFRSGGDAFFSKASSYAARFNRNTNDGDVLTFAKDGTTVGSIGVLGDRIYLAGVNEAVGLDDSWNAFVPLSTGGGNSDNDTDLGNPSSRWKDLYLSSGAYASFIAGQNDTNTSINFPGSDVITFNNGGSEAARIDASGNLIVGGGALNTVNAFSVHPATNPYIGLNKSLTGTHDAFYFQHNGSVIGKITYSDSATAYVTSSDQRLKENIADADDAGSKVDAIQVRKFDWKADGSHQDYGMIAQELIEVAPEAVSAPEDPDEMMGVDYSKLVPMLVKEIQQLRQRVAQLEE